MRDFNPPPSYYDSPEGHSDVCQCQRCHQHHIEGGMVEENTKIPFDEFQCCKDTLETWIEEGRWCGEHGSAYLDPENNCLECAAVYEP